jgi:K+-sensing histidine kinase KdpD
MSFMHQILRLGLEGIGATRMTAMQQGSSAFESTHGHSKDKYIFHLLVLTLRALLGLLLCFVAALVFSKLLAHSPLGQYLPLCFVAVLVLVAARFGAIASVLGAVVAIAVFAYSLYPPLGSLRIADFGARESLAWMLLGALAISFLLFPPKRSSSPRQ